MLPELKIEFNTRAIDVALDTHPKLQEMRQKMIERYGVSEGRARSMTEEVLTRMVRRVGTKYMDAMVENITHLFKLRDQASSIVERVIGDEALTPEKAGSELKNIFNGIKSDMDAITDPAKFAKKSSLKADPDISKDVDAAFAEFEKESPKPPGKPLELGRHVEKIEVLRSKFEALGKAKRQVIRKAADFAPHELWKAASSETEAGLARNLEVLKSRARAEGLSNKEINALEQAVSKMSEERAKSQRLPGTAEAVLRAEALKKLDPKLRKLVEGDRYLELLAAENPYRLDKLFEQSGAKSRSALRRYIRHRMVTHVRGAVGEQITAFALGERMVLLKVPAITEGFYEDVTFHGTDLVGVTKDGRIWLIDNKAWNQAELPSVSSLTGNLPGSVVEDAAALKGKFGLGDDPEIGDAIARLNKATKEIRDLTKGMDPKQVNKAAMQKALDKICQKYGIDRVVTNVGGKIEGLSDKLKKAKILFENLNQPADPDVPLTGSRHYELNEE